MIEIKKLTLQRGLKVLLDKADAVINPGQRVGLIGKNGTGKSSLFALTMGWTMERQQAVYPENLLSSTAAHDKVVWIASPAVLNRLGENRNWQSIGHKIAGIVSAGGALPAATADLLQQAAVRY